MIEVVRSDHAGFCFGVRRAVSMVLKEADRGESVFTLGPLIHNPQAVRMLEERGVIPVDDVSQIRKGIVAYRSHGVRKEEADYIRKKGWKVLDATCPFVKRVRMRALALKRLGYKVVIVGDEEHPEVKSILSYLDDDGIVLRKSFPVKAKKLGIVSQTTQDWRTFLDVVQGCMEKAEEIRVYNTICESTALRQKEALALAGGVDAMVVVGGRNSSNTTKLFQMVKMANPSTYHIETEKDLRPEWFSGVQRVGLTGGASTPDIAIDNVERAVKNI
jgi:4-hydroxy-3-methylbut-2-en-1-yl diphosphate reductase